MGLSVSNRKVKQELLSNASNTQSFHSRNTFNGYPRMHCLTTSQVSLLATKKALALVDGFMSLPLCTQL